MKIFHTLSLLIALSAKIANAQHAQQDSLSDKDSIVLAVHPAYDEKSGFHHFLFGRNYRKEWATPVKLPVLHISKLHGGLRPVKEGGGMQSKSLRLTDLRGKEWVLRAVEKTPNKLLPPGFEGTFALDWLDDGISSQHPFSALIVPPLAQAAGVAHANPVIGVVAADAALGEYNKDFAGVVALLEEREPAGKSESTVKMLAGLRKDYNNRLLGELFLKARMLDLLIGDWDRHEDQWRWASTKNGDQKFYQPVPRDRDQVFHVVNGVGPTLAALPWIDPMLDHFDGAIPHVKYSLFKTRFIQAYRDAQFSYAEWMRIAQDFVRLESDDVLEAGLRRLPQPMYAIRHEELLRKLKARRDNIPKAMDEYYRFINKTVDVVASDKNEIIQIKGTPDGDLQVVMKREVRSEEKTLMNVTYRQDITKEIRIYTGNGDDQVSVLNNTSPIRLRIIGAHGGKSYQINTTYGKIRVYGRKDSLNFGGNTNSISKHLFNDTSNTRFVQNNPYNVWMPLATAAVTADDGFLLGFGFRFTQRQGFRKVPYASVQQLLVTHSFATSAFRIRYNGEWTAALGKADIVLNGFVQAPTNTLNFFGKGNEAALQKFSGYRRFYRTRFNTYELEPGMRWRLNRYSSLTAGPSLQYYHLDAKENEGRFINNIGLINSYDSSIVAKNKLHLGVSLQFITDRRDNKILPASGYQLKLVMKAYSGMNDHSRNYLQLIPEVTYYRSLFENDRLVVSNRIGGGVTLGSPAFYQSMFLGGQGNLLGYLQNRFAGDHVIYNNLQARVKVCQIKSYIMPGQFGLTGFYDTGRVWLKDGTETNWHSGKGGGLYFAPVGLAVIQLLAGNSPEGWYPYLSLNVRL